VVLIDAPPEKVIISSWFIAPEAKLSALAQNLCAPLTIIESSVGLANRYIALLSPDVNINVSDVESASQVSKVLKAPSPASDFPEAVTLLNVLVVELAKLYRLPEALWKYPELARMNDSRLPEALWKYPELFSMCDSRLPEASLK
tara:strand:- start:120 stop:554 length:435 start_codon:yes stop_codon:yes gene_type:complete